MRRGTGAPGERGGEVRRRRWLVLASAILTASCGYSLQGRGITTDPSVKRIGVPLFKDRTGKLGLDTRITAAVIEELSKRGRFTVVKETTNVDAVVEGEIEAYNVLPVDYNTTSNDSQTSTLATRYTASVVAKVVYRKIGQPEPIWENDSMNAIEPNAPRKNKRLGPKRSVRNPAGIWPSA